MVMSRFNLPHLDPSAYHTCTEIHPHLHTHTGTDMHTLAHAMDTHIRECMHGHTHTHIFMHILIPRLEH